MEIKNKFEKFLLSFSGTLLVVVLVLGMKIKNEEAEKEKLKNEIKNNFFDISQSVIQKRISTDRESTISKIVDSPGSKTIEQIITTTKTPPPPVVSTPKPDKKTKTS